jgi:hypothetical protein
MITSLDVKRREEKRREASVVVTSLYITLFEGENLEEEPYMMIYIG